MPQLMPLFWGFSSFFFFMLAIVMSLLYSIYYLFPLNEYLAEVGGNKISWCW